MIDSDIVTVTVGVTDPVTVAARRDRRRGCAAASEAATVTRPLRQCPGRGPGLAAASPRLAPGPRPRPPAAARASPSEAPTVTVTGPVTSHGDRDSLRRDSD